ncbi:MAG TPA: hypothetical protein VHE37_15430 [Nevskiaceae bacterium]|nr:hypothetical protein [Nevskiaceae bacterium]
MARSEAGADLPALARQLGVPPARVEFLASLSDAQRRQLAADLERAREQHARHIRGLMDEALNHLPWLLRAPIKKLFGG